MRCAFSRVEIGGRRQRSGHRNTTQQGVKTRIFFGSRSVGRGELLPLALGCGSCGGPSSYTRLEDHTHTHQVERKTRRVPTTTWGKRPTLASATDKWRCQAFPAKCQARSRSCSCGGFDSSVVMLHFVRTKRGTALRLERSCVLRPRSQVFQYARGGYS